MNIREMELLTKTWKLEHSLHYLFKLFEKL